LLSISNGNSQKKATTKKDGQKKKLGGAGSNFLVFI
jgi:hypothetical protein